MISKGSSPEPSGFLDASANGEDVFFLTTSALSPRDTDTAYDVYDARVNGTEPQPSRRPSCLGDSCQGVVTPEDLTPGCLTFPGPGNLLQEPPPIPVHDTAARRSQEAH